MLQRLLVVIQVVVLEREGLYQCAAFVGFECLLAARVRSSGSVVGVGRRINETAVAAAQIHVQEAGFAVLGYSVFDSGVVHADFSENGVVGDVSPTVCSHSLRVLLETLQVEEVGVGW